MLHVHKATGLKFDCGELMELPKNGKRATYDITVIMLWRGDDDSPILVNYYFGEYNAETTDYYIDQWMQTVCDCKDIVEAYQLTNADVLTNDEFTDLRNKVNRTLDALSDVVRAISV